MGTTSQISFFDSLLVASNSGTFAANGDEVAGSTDFADATAVAIAETSQKLQGRVRSLLLLSS